MMITFFDSCTCKSLSLWKQWSTRDGGKFLIIQWVFTDKTELNNVQNILHSLEYGIAFWIISKHELCRCRSNSNGRNYSCHFCHLPFQYNEFGSNFINDILRLRPIHGTHCQIRKDMDVYILAHFRENIWTGVQCVHSIAITKINLTECSAKVHPASTAARSFAATVLVLKCEWPTQIPTTPLYVHIRFEIRRWNAASLCGWSNATNAEQIAM